MNSHRVCFLALVLVATAFMASGCSSFRKDARLARATTPPGGSPEGIYEGRWHKSDQPNHGGRQEMVLTQTGHTLYRASARSQWWRIFRSSYDTTVVLTPVRPGEYIMQGGKSLWLVGDYTILARVDPATIKGEFAAGNETGVIELQRPASVPVPTPK